MDTLVKTVNNTDIFLNDRGTFYAVISGKKVTRSSLRAIVGEIQSKQSPITLYAVGGYYNGKHITAYEIMKFSDSDVATDKDGNTHKSYNTTFYDLNPKQVEKLTKLAKQIEALFAEWDEITSNATSVNGHNFEKVRLSKVANEK